MSVRSLNGLSGSNNIYVNTVSAQEPLELLTTSNTSSTMTLKGLNGFTANKILKVNSAGTALEYADDNDTQYGATSPLVLTGTTFSLAGLSGLTANKILKVNSAGTAFEYVDDNNTQYGATSPLVLTGTTFSLAGLSGLGTAGQFIKINSGGTGFEYGSDNNTLYFATSPLVLTGTTFSLAGLSSLGEAGEFIKVNSTGTGLEFGSDNNTHYTAMLPLAQHDGFKQYTFDIFALTPANTNQITDTLIFCIGVNGSNSFRKMTGLQLKTYINTIGNDFGTGTQIGERTLGNLGYATNLEGTEVKINGTGTGAFLKLNQTTSAIITYTGRNIFGLDGNTGNVVFGNAVDTTELFSTTTLGKTLKLSNTLEIGNATANNVWADLIQFRQASTSTNVWGLSSYFDSTGGQGNFFAVRNSASNTTLFEIRNDGQIFFPRPDKRFIITPNVELIGNYTINTTPAVNTTNMVVLQQYKTDRQANNANTNKYNFLQRYNMSYSSIDEAFIRWTYSAATNTGTPTIAYTGFCYHTANGGTDILNLTNTGNLGILGTLSESDKRVKKDIIDADGEECINVLKSLKLKKYKYIDAYVETFDKTTGYVYGFIADEVIENPYLSYTGDISQKPKHLNDGTILTDFKSIEKPRILSVLWGVCDFQQNKIEEQQTEIELLKSEIANIKSHLNL